MNFVEVKYPETEMLQTFLKNAGNSLDRFRYFKTREMTCLQNHAYTTLLVNDKNVPVAYGHLDRENDVIWLGIAVAEDSTGKGFGKSMLRHLLDTAKEKQLNPIRLSVDNANETAVGLYTQVGFRLAEKRELISFYEYDFTK